MKVAKIIPKTIPILILLQEKRKIWCEIGQKTLYLVVLGSGGELGIRTPGDFHLNGFQDRRFRPLSQLSISGASI